MSGGETLFSRWRGRSTPHLTQTSEPLELPAVGLQILLDDQARVLRLAGPLRPALALPTQSGATLIDYVQPQSRLSLEGQPGDWQHQTLDLDFKGPAGQTLFTRGWLLQWPGGWMLQMFDIGDLIQERRQAHSQEQQQRLQALKGPLDSGAGGSRQR